MVWKKISNNFLVLKNISFLGIANIIPTVIAAGFWFYIASLVGDSTYGEIIYYLTIAGIASGITILGAPNTILVYTAKNVKLSIDYLMRKNVILRRMVIDVAGKKT